MEQGLEEDLGGNAIYLSIMEGKLIRRVKEAGEGSTERVNKMDKIVFEKKYKSVTGIIVAIKKRDHAEYGSDWRIHLRNGETLFVISMYCSSNYAEDFMKRVENLDMSIPVKLAPYYILDEEKNKYRGYFVPYQNGNKVESLYTKENDWNGLPKMEQITVKGKEVWDNSKRIDYFETMLETKIRPQFEGLSAADSSPEITAPAPEATDASQTDGTAANAVSTNDALESVAPVIQDEGQGGGLQPDGDGPSDDLPF